jgi:hypothetical protein
MAQPLPRRGALKAIGGAVIGGAALAVVRPFRGDATCVGAVCGSTCCFDGQVCLDPTKNKCGCKAGAQVCGPFLCCDAGSTCNQVNNTTHCCCPAGTKPCGRACCPAGAACLDKVIGICGCAPGTTTCHYGSQITCCDSGVACPPTPTCPNGPPKPLAATCASSFSDVNLKEHIIPVVWENS